jgi:hypothetical protein
LTFPRARSDYCRLVAYHDLTAVGPSQHLRASLALRPAAQDARLFLCVALMRWGLSLPPGGVLDAWGQGVACGGGAESEVGEVGGLSGVGVPQPWSEKTRTHAASARRLAAMRAGWGEAAAAVCSVEAAAARELREAAARHPVEPNVYVTAALFLLRTGNYSAAARALAAVAQDARRGRDPFSRFLAVAPGAGAQLPALLHEAASAGGPRLGFTEEGGARQGSEREEGLRSFQQGSVANGRGRGSDGTGGDGAGGGGEGGREGALASRAAVVYLTSDAVDDVVDLCHSLRLLRRHFFALHGRYPVIVLHDGLSAAHAARIRDAAGAAVSLHVVEVELRAAARRWQEMANGSHAAIRRFSQAPQHGLGYRSMCRFFAGPLVHLEITHTLNLEYLLRLDTDSFFPAALPFDPFVYVAGRRAVYGYVTTALEEPAMAEGLLSLMQTAAVTGRGESSSAARSVPSASVASAETLLESGALGGGARGHWDGTFYYNNFELLYLPFFRAPAYRELFDTLDASGGFFAKRWGDGPVRTLALGMLARADQVVKLEGLPYWHQTAVFL